nr:DNA polymerase III subunit delta [Streptococcus oricebi]
MDQLASLSVLTGEDLGQFSLLKEEFLKRIAFDTSDLNYSYFDMKEANYSEIELDLVSLPFFTEEKIIILDHFQDLTTAKKRFLSDEELKSFEAYLENPVSTTKLIIFAEGKLDSKRRLVKILKRDGHIYTASEPKEQELRHYFSHKADQEGLVFAQGAFEQVLVKSSFQYSEISRNLAFLKSYKGQGQIELADVDQALPKTLQDNIFDLTQLILSSQVDAARALVQDLRLQGEDEIKLIAIMLGQFRIFTQVKILSQAGRQESQIVADLSEILGRRVNPYQVKFALKDSRKLQLSFLKKTLKILIETDFQIKSGLYDKDYLFDLALLKIAAADFQAD